MRSIKQYLLKHELIWAHFRLLKRNFSARRADRKHYFKVNRISRKQLLGARQKFEQSIRYIHMTINGKARINNSHSIYDTSRHTIAQCELDILSNMGDQMGKVFKYRGEIYRGIYKRSVEDFYKIYNSGVLQGLSEQGMIPATDIASFTTDEFPIVLHVEKVLIQKNNLWSYAMVLDACRLVSLIYFILQKYDLTLCDGHLNNISFVKGKPIFVDIGSIIPKRPTGAKEELVFGGLYRLLFGYLGNCMLYRLPSHDGNNNNIFIKPRFYNQYTREYRYCLKKFKGLMFFSGGMKKYQITKRVFDLYDIRPEYIDVLFDKEAVTNIREANNIEQLFSLLNWNDFMNLTIIDTGGVYPLIRRAVQSGVCFRFINIIDFEENRLDASYRDWNRNNLDADIAFSLINYIYILDEILIDRIKSDIVFCINPTSNCASFHGNNMYSIAYALNRIGDKYVIVFIDSEIDNNLDDYDELKRALCIYYQVEEKRQNDIRCIIGRRKYNEGLDENYSY